MKFLQNLYLLLGLYVLKSLVVIGLTLDHEGDSDSITRSTGSAVENQHRPTTQRNLESVDPLHRLQYLIPPDSSMMTTQSFNETCRRVCDDPTAVGTLFPESNISDVDDDGNSSSSSSSSLSQKISNHVNQSLNGEGMLSRLMNRLFGFTFPNRSSGGTNEKYNIPTETIVSMLSTYSQKAESLAASIRRQGQNYTASLDADTAEILTSLHDLSAENMELVAALIDPIVADMNQSETINSTNIGCSFGQILVFIRDTTLPNILSITEIVYTKLGNAQMKRQYEAFVAGMTSVNSNSLFQSSKTDESTNQCFDLGNDSNFAKFTRMQESENSIQDRISNFLDRLPFEGEVLFLTVHTVFQIIYYPFSFVVSISAIIFSTYLIIFFIIFKRMPKFLKPLFPDEENGWGEVFFVFVLFYLIVYPIVVPLDVLANIAFFFYLLLIYPFTQSGVASIGSLVEPSLDMTNVISPMDLEPSMERMLNAISLLIRNEAALDDEFECDMKSVICKSYELLNALP
jgi:hypothetical protein